MLNDVDVRNDVFVMEMFVYAIQRLDVLHAMFSCKDFEEKINEISVGSGIIIISICQ